MMKSSRNWFTVEALVWTEWGLLELLLSPEQPLVLSVPGYTTVVSI